MRKDGLLQRAPATRARVVERLASATLRPIAVIVAPAGYGKTTALHEFLATTQAPAAYFRVRPEHDTLAGFVRGFAEALQPVSHIAASTVADALRNASASESAPRDLAQWLSTHLADSGGWIAVDDLHLVDSDAAIMQFLASLIERNKKDIHWIVAARTLQNLPLASWLAYGDTDLPLGQNDLAFTYDEALQAARAVSERFSEADVEHLHKLTGGWPTAFRFSLIHADTAADLGSISASTRKLTHQYIAEQVFNGFDDDAKELLCFASLLPAVDVGVLEAAGFSRARRTLEGLIDCTSFLTIDPSSQGQSPPVRYQIHDIFREFLEHRVHLEDDKRRSELFVRAANALRQCGEPIGALRLLVRASKTDDILALLAEQGFDLLERGHLDTIRIALNAVEECLPEDRPIQLGLLAQLESDAGRFDRACALFERAVAACADRNLRAALVARLTAVLFCLGRNPVPLLEPIAFDPLLHKHLGGELQSLLLCGYAAFEAGEHYQPLVERTETLANAIEEQEVRARMFQRIGYAAFVAGDAERASRALRNAAALASELDLMSLLGKTYGVWCNVAYICNDDPREALRLARSEKDASELAGKSFLARGALATQALLAARLGERETLDDVLSSFESGFVDDDPRLQLMVLEARAYRAAWDGDFVRADEHLRACAEATFAEDRMVKTAIGVLVALGAGRKSDALAAIDSAMAELPKVERTRLSIDRFREVAYWLCAIGEVMAGRNKAPARRARGVEAPAAVVLRDIALSVARDLSLGPRIAAPNEHYQRLRALGYGGFALLLDALFRAAAPAADFEVALTSAELVVLRLLAAGSKPKEIAVETNSTVHTIRTHIKRIIAKLECSGSDQAVRLARAKGLI